MTEQQQTERAGLYGSNIGANMLSAAIAETIGTAILIYGGTAVAVAALLGQPVAGTAYDSLATPLAFGLALMIVVASIGHISGAHVNPAVTLGLAVARRFPWRYVPAYLAAQLAGAVLGALATWATFGTTGRLDANLAATIPGPNVGTAQALLVEAIVTFVLVLVVVSVATDDRVPASLAPTAVGAALAVAVLIAGPVTGGAVNRSAPSDPPWSQANTHSSGSTSSARSSVASPPRWSTIASSPKPRRPPDRALVRG